MRAATRQTQRQTKRKRKEQQGQCSRSSSAIATAAPQPSAASLGCVGDQGGLVGQRRIASADATRGTPLRRGSRSRGRASPARRNGRRAARFHRVFVAAPPVRPSFDVRSCSRAFLGVPIEVAAVCQGNLHVSILYEVSQLADCGSPRGSLRNSHRPHSCSGRISGRSGHEHGVEPKTTKGRADERVKIQRTSS